MLELAENSWRPLLGLKVNWYQMMKAEWPL